jgi:nicotinamidase/pyrazinamidase
MERITQNTLIIVDAQRGFMPASEGERLEKDGFDELGVTDGDKIVSPINRLSAAFARANWPIATTQDYHPSQTAHFSETPNFVDTWPVHCVGGTSGAELHPDLLVAQQPELATHFIKGDIACTSPADDTSYTGALAYNPETGVTLPDWLHAQRTKHVYVTGLALGDGSEHKLCVDSTASDLHRQGFDVTLITDATEAVLPENRELCMRRLGASGIHLVTTAELLHELEGEK